MAMLDAIVMVDWSAASRPTSGRDSIWFAVGRRQGRGFDFAPPENPRTRPAAEERLVGLLAGLASEGARVLIGFDFPYGYPCGLASALELPDGVPPWAAVWRHWAAKIQDGDRNENNRFEFASELNARIGPGEGPFWGCPNGSATPFLRPDRGSRWDFPYAVPAGGVLECKRQTEARMSGVQETWKLYGVGSVGSQALMGIPCVERLRRHPDLAAFSRVWPFETGFTPHPLPARGPFVLHAEIWPGAVVLDARSHLVRDAAQVVSLSRHVADLDTRGCLGNWFGEPEELSASAREACIVEEGWILGS